MTPTKTRHLRVAQSNISDAQFLQELAGKSRGEDGDGKAGYVFFVQDDELHFIRANWARPRRCRWNISRTAKACCAHSAPRRSRREPSAKAPRC